MNQIRSRSFVSTFLASARCRKEVGCVIGRNEEPIFKRDPAIFRCLSFRAVGARHRQCDQLRSGLFVSGEANGKAAAESLQILQKKLGVATAAA